MRNIPLDIRSAVAIIHAVDNGIFSLSLDDREVVTLTVRDVVRHQACSATTARRVIRRLEETGHCRMIHPGGRGESAIYELTGHAFLFAESDKNRAIYREYQGEFSTRRQIRVVRNATIMYPFKENK